MKIVKKALIVFLSALMIFFISCSFDNGAGNVRNAPCAIRGEENVPQELRHLHDKVKICAKKRGFSRLKTNISGFEEDQSSSNPEFFVS